MCPMSRGRWPSRSTAESTGHRAFNVGSGVVTTIGEVARALSRECGGPEPVVTGEFRLGDVRHVTASSELAARELRFRANVSLEDGVRDLAGAGDVGGAR